MEYQSNPQLDLAFDYVGSTNRNVFLTGKAGTGKTTFLLRLKQECVKRMAVVAPTGVAAINAGGMTIHSLFQLPFGPFLPDNAQDAARQRRFTREKIKLVQGLDLLVIDEISMVRADLLDAIDDVLRRYKTRDLPFGGVQLLMIGDLHQLPPVVKDEEWGILRDHYDTPYFFSSNALKRTNPIAIELKHIYRQSDGQFISLLNRVRDNALDEKVLEELNSRYIPDFRPPDDEPYITLTSHNAAAQGLNAESLAALPGKVYRYKAIIEGDFPAQAYPTDEVLEIKKGAQVMFVKNDLSREKRFYNGKIGQVVRLNQDFIVVKCPGDYTEIEVSSVEWANVKYSLDDATKEIHEEVLGTFTQYPLRLAWAITIHKSQGLTFERAIIDAQAAFAHGQVYVALSRCKRFEGIVLRSRIGHSSVKTDATVRHYTQEADRNPPDEADLHRSKHNFQKGLLLELFDFRNLQKYLNNLHRTFLAHESSLLGQARQQVAEMKATTEKDILPVVEKTRSNLLYHLQQPTLPEAHDELQAFVRRAVPWFLEKVDTGLMATAKALEVITDNKAVRKVAEDDLADLQRELCAKVACFRAAKDGFVANTYLRAKADALIDFKVEKPAKTLADAFTDAPKDTAHPELYARLKQWRTDTAEELNQPAFQVMSTASLLQITEMLPVTASGLKRVKGIGDGKIRQFGDTLLHIINEYCREKGLEGSQLALVPDTPKPPKPNTKQISLDLFRSGKSVAEIAEERGFVTSTIIGHLTHYIAAGDLALHELLPLEAIAEIMDAIEQHPDVGLAELRMHLQQKYEFGEIRAVVSHLERERAAGEEG